MRQFKQKLKTALLSLLIFMQISGGIAVPVAFADETLANPSPSSPSLAIETSGLLANELNLSVQTGLEMNTLLEGLKQVVLEIEKSQSADKIINRISAMRDSSSVEYIIPGIGKAGLKVLSDGRQFQIFRTIKHNSGLYAMIVDQDMDPDFILKKYEATDKSQLTKEQLDEYNSAKTIRRGLNKFASHMLMFGVVNEQYTPLTTKIDESAAELLNNKSEASKALEKEISPLRRRYQQINLLMQDEGLTKKQKRRLIAEQRILERETLRIANNPNSKWGKIVETSLLSREESYSIEGLPTMIIYHKDGRYMNHELRNKPALFSWSYFKKYLNAVVESPSGGDVVASLGFGAVQALLAGSVGYLVQFSGLSTSVDPATLAAVSFKWGLIMGALNRTLNNFMYSSSSEFSRNIKTAVTGMGFGYDMQTTGDTSLLELSFFQHFSIWLTQYSKNVVKAGSQDIVKFNYETGETKGEHVHELLRERNLDWERKFNVPLIGTFTSKISGLIFKGGIKLKIDKRNVDANTWQLALFPGKLLSLLGLWPAYWAMGPILARKHVTRASRYAKKFAESPEFPGGEPRGNEHPRSKHWARIAEEIQTAWDNNRLIEADSILIRLGLSRNDIEQEIFYDEFLKEIADVNERTKIVDEALQSIFDQDQELVMWSEINAKTSLAVYEFRKTLRKLLYYSLVSAESTSKYAGYYISFLKGIIVPMINYFKAERHKKMVRSIVGRAILATELQGRTLLPERSHKYSYRPTQNKRYAQNCARLLNDDTQ